MSQQRLPVQSNCGFTLIEVMVALTVFAMAATAIVSAVTSHVSNLQLLKEQTIANYVASNRITEIQLENRWPIQNNLSKRVDMADSSWYWQQTVIDTPVNNFKAVRVSVAKDAAITDVVTELTVYMAKPSSSSVSGQKRGG